MAALQAAVGLLLPRQLRAAAPREGPLLRRRPPRLPLARAQVRQDGVARREALGRR